MRFLLLPILIASTLTLATSLFGQFDPTGQPFSGIESERGSYLGVHLVDIDVNRAKILKLGEARGVEIVGVEEGSPAAISGLKAGDILLSYNGENILSARQLGRLVSETPSGRRVAVQSWRHGKTIEAAVLTAPPPASEWALPGVRNLEPRDLLNFAFIDVPTPLVLWKNLLLGVECEPLESQLAEFFGVRHGVLIRSVDRGSAADKAGLKAGDVLTGIGDRSIFSPRDLTSYVRAERQPVKSLSLELTRDRRRLIIHILLAEMQEP